MTNNQSDVSEHGGGMVTCELLSYNTAFHKKLDIDKINNLYS